jgi:hypothetical protein
MKTPFIFGKLASGDDFTDRTQEIMRLKGNFISGINSIIISPRRWGKSSLVEKAAREIREENTNIRIISMDLFNVRTEDDFYRILAEKVIRGTTTRLSEIQSFVKKFFKQWIPKISFSPDHAQEFSLGLNWTEVMKQPDEILDLPQRIATTKGWKIILCIDEFQNIAFYNDTLSFQKQLRAHWQRHPDVSYCLFGSKRHMLLNVFTSPSMPFYKFGDLVFLEKISTSDWEQFITSRFKDTGKNILPEQSIRIALMVENHPYYVQQLAQQCWLRCNKKMTDEIIDQSHEALTLQLGLLFQNLTESLSNMQVNYLQAIINEETHLSSSDIIGRYHLGTSANVSRIKTALIEKEIIDIQHDRNEFVDPIYKNWLKKFYFAK